jgi:uncharacterized protein YdaU (DUF1376 family)
MAEFPALPLWTDAYLGDTTHLTTIEHGAYLLLLMTAWRTRDCALPDDDRLLARYARLNTQQWKRMRPIIEAFFTIENGFWKQGRLTDERGAVERHRLQQSEKGKAGAAAKSLKRQERDKAAAKSGSTSAEAQVQPDASSLTHTQCSEDKSSGGEPPADPIKQVFDLGVSILVAASCTEKNARSLIGKWRKSHGEAKVLQGLLDCRARGISDPVEWLEKRFAGSKYTSASGYEYRGDERAVMREAEKRADWGVYWQAKANLEGERQTANG